MKYQLTCFEGESPFEVSLDLSPNQHHLSLTYTVEGDLNLLEIPPQAAVPMRRIGLWENSCFEFFIKNKSSDDYFEFNFSPSTNWNVFIFHQIRGPLKEWDTEERPQFSLQQEKGQLVFKADIPWPLFPEGFIEEKMMLFSPTTILLLKDSTILHFAKTHPDGKLDFHRYESFTERL